MGGIAVAVSMGRVHMAMAEHPVIVLLCVPAVRTAASRVHKEIGNGGELQSQLLGNGDLHLLGRASVLSKDGYQGATLQVGEDQSRLLWHLVALSSSVLLLAFTCLRKMENSFIIIKKCDSWKIVFVCLCSVVHVL